MKPPVFADLKVCDGVFWRYERPPWAPCNLGAKRAERLVFLRRESCRGCPTCDAIKVWLRERPHMCKFPQHAWNGCVLQGVWEINSQNQTRLIFRLKRKHRQPVKTAV